MRTRLRTLTVALVMGLVAVTPPASGSAAIAASSAASPEPTRAMWVWDRPPVADLVAFATGQGVDELFVSVPDDLASAPSLGWYRELRTVTRSAGIHVQALGSETTWIDHPRSALAWQASALSTGLFDGVHLDVEPWIHDEWARQPTAVAARYLRMLDRLVAASPLPVEADIAFWLDQVRVRGERLDRAVIARVDAVTVLTYRHVVTGPDSITELGARAVAAATRAHKPVRLALETNDLGSGPIARKQTFHGFTRAQLQQAMGAVDSAETAAGARAASYRGIAVHDEVGWAALSQ